MERECHSRDFIRDFTKLLEQELIWRFPLEEIFWKCLCGGLWSVICGFWKCWMDHTTCQWGWNKLDKKVSDCIKVWKPQRLTFTVKYLFCRLINIEYQSFQWFVGFKWIGGRILDQPLTCSLSPSNLERRAYWNFWETRAEWGRLSVLFEKIMTGCQHSGSRPWSQAIFALFFLFINICAGD